MRRRRRAGEKRRKSRRPILRKLCATLLRPFRGQHSEKMKGSARGNWDPREVQQPFRPNPNGVGDRTTTLRRLLIGADIFCSSDEFSEGTLPTKQDVINSVLSKDHFFSMNAARVVAVELVKHWIWSNVCPIHELTVAMKIFNMMTEFNAVDHYHKKKRSNIVCCKKKPVYD